MTIQTDSRTTSEMLTDGSNKVFHFGFPIFKGDNGQKGVEVLFVNDLGFDVVDPSLFAVIEDSDNSGGIVQFYEAPETGKRLVITGNTPVDQQLDITNYNRFHGASIETNFDKIIAIAQEFFSKLNEEIRQRINNNLEVRDYVDNKLSELEDWAISQIPDIAKSQFDLMLNDFKMEWQNALNTITLKVGVPALAVMDESGVTQQEINNLAGAPYRVKVGGYNIGERVLLENGDIVKSTVSSNTVDPNIDMTGWVDLARTGRLIDTRLYGLKVNTELDQTAAIHAAFAANPNCNNFYIPSGTIKANVVFPRTYMQLIGDGMLSTIIEPYDLTKPAVNFNKKLYSGLRDLSIRADQTYTSAQLIDARDTRYKDFKNVDVKKIVRDGQTHKYETILIDDRLVVSTWTGYNKFKNVRGTYGAYGYLSDVNQLNSVLQMDGCVFSYNGYFNIKTSGSNATLINMDVANGGKLAPVGVYDETTYGGIYFRGDNSVILGVWHEYNARATLSYSSNNLYIDPASSNVTHNFARDSRSNTGVRVYRASQGALQDVNTADQALDDGQGRARPQQLLRNSTFRHWDSSLNRPRGWSGYFSGSTFTQETSDLPSGYNYGVKLVSTAAGNSGLYQAIYNPANLSTSYIKDITKWVGRTITVSFWVKNIGNSETSFRGGISLEPTNVYFGAPSKYISSLPTGEWQKVSVRHTIDGTEARISVGFRIAGIGAAAIVTGFSFADDIRTFDSQPMPITEDGGEVFGDIEVLGDLKVRGSFTNNGLSPVFRPTTVTTTDLANATATINTVEKHVGKQVFNNTDSLMYYATATTPTSLWKSFDSTNTITPA